MKYSFVLLAYLLASQTAFADLTLRWKMDIKPGAAIPAQAAEMMKQQLAASGMTGMTMRVKGQRIQMEVMKANFFADYARGEITILRPEAKRYSTMPISEYPPQLPATSAMPPEAQKMLANMKVQVDTKKTGRTGMVQGIRAEENLLTLDMELPIPNAPVPVGMRMEMENWTAMPDEQSRLPALSEFAAVAGLARKLYNPAAMMEKLTAQMPGLAERMREPMAKFMAASTNVGVKMHMTMSIPGMAAMMEEARKQGKPVPPGMDFSGPLMEMTMELVELSSQPVEEAVFQIPAGYTQEAMQDSLTQMQSKAAVEPPKPGGPGVYRVGGGVTAPKLKSKVEPEYTPEANHDKVEGTSVLYVEVGPDGAAHNIRVVKSLRPDLDQKAILAVTQWVFEPGMKEGKAVTVAATIEVNFRLAKKPQ